MKQTYRRQETEVLVYTRECVPDCYPAGLAGGIHFAVKRENGTVIPLNGNYGILYAEALIDDENVIQPRCCREPYVIAVPDRELWFGGAGIQPMGKRAFGKRCYGICADRVLENGERDLLAEGRKLVWLTEDFCHFRFCGLVDAAQLPKERITRLPRTVADRMLLFWGKIRHIRTENPAETVAEDAAQLERVGAVAVYSDGSTADKRILWNMEDVDFSCPGTYTVRGKVFQERYRFPLTEGFADPVVFYWDGMWYYISTNDNRNDIGIYVRESETVPGLFEKEARMSVILDYDEKRQLIQTFWAPEFHVIGGRLYILFAVGGKKWGPQCHMMRLKKGGKIMDPESWEDPVRVIRRDGKFLAEEHITLDMTYLETRAGSYVIWSERSCIGTALDSGSMLMIAEIEPEKPWQLASEPVLLSRPLYGWENVSGTINNEGPYAFVTEDRVYLTYSGGAADGYTYVLGMLEADTDSNLLELASWEKSPAPVLSFYSVEGQYGPGHNSFFTDDEGNLMIAFHGETGLAEHRRCTGIRRVHFDVNGRPRFDLSDERDLNPRLADVEIKVTVPQRQAESGFKRDRRD